MCVFLLSSNAGIIGGMVGMNVFSFSGILASASKYQKSHSCML